MKGFFHKVCCSYLINWSLDNGLTWKMRHFYALALSKFILGEFLQIYNGLSQHKMFYLL